MRVVAAMSGGVDSAVAAARMLDAGHEVVGVHLALSQSAATLRESARGCCTIEDAGDARRVADMLGIPFYVWDMAARFKRDVDRGLRRRVRRRPHPQPVPALQREDQVRRAARQGGGARLRRGGHRPLRAGRRAARTARRELHRAVDMAKDQSYVLGVLDADQLARSFFPLGDTTKPQIREEAARARLLRREQARQPRHLLHRRRRHPRVADAAARRAARRHRRHRRRRSSARTAAPTRSPSASARASASTGPPPDGEPRYVVEVQPRDQHRRRRHRRPARRRRDHRRPRPLVRAARPRASSRSAPRCARTARRSRPRPGPTGTGVEVRLDGADPRRRTRPVGRPLRRHARRGVGHDQRRRASR